MVSHLPATNICLGVNNDLLPRFFQLLERGFMVKTLVGCSIKTLLCQQLDMSPEYLDERIQTIFLDSKPVDDVNCAIVRDGSTLALSGAMPGLVGATFRKGGYYAPMRSQISHKGETESESLQKGAVFLKFFNILLREMGPAFLKRGVWVNGGDLEGLLERHSNELRAGFREATLDGEKIDLDKLLEVKWGDRQVFLQLK